MTIELPRKIISELYHFYCQSQKYHVGNGVKFELSFLEYQDLWSNAQKEKIIRWFKSGRLRTSMKHKEKGYVLSWRRKADYANRVMNKETARILTRDSSQRRFWMQAGDKHTEKARKAIGDAQRGRKRSDEHRAAISRARKGVKQTPEQVAARVAATAITKAKKLEAKR